MSSFDEVLKSCINIKNIERTPEDYIDEYLGNVQTQIGRTLLSYPDPRWLELFIPVIAWLRIESQEDKDIVEYAQGRIVTILHAVMRNDKRIHKWIVWEVAFRWIFVKILK
jgi:hypothetical protein